MKKIIYTLIIVFLCILITSCDNSYINSTTNDNSLSILKDESNVNKDCKLIINSEVVSNNDSVSINYEKKYAELPLLAIAKGLGCEVSWHSKNKVTIAVGDKNFILNPQKGTLNEEGNTFNIIAVPPGTQHAGYSKVFADEFVIDSDSIRYFINLLGAKITIDYEEAIINIEEK